MDQSSEGPESRAPLSWAPGELPDEPDRAAVLLNAGFRRLAVTFGTLPPTLRDSLDEVLEGMAERSRGPERVLLSPLGTPAFPMLAWIEESLGPDSFTGREVERAAEAMVLTYLAVRCQDDLVDESWADPTWTYLADALSSRALRLLVDLCGDPGTFLNAWSRQVEDFSEAAALDARWRADPATVWDVDAIHLQGRKFLPMAGPLTALLVRAGRADRISDLERTVTRLGIGLQLANDLFGAAGDLTDGLHSTCLGWLGLVPGRDDRSALDAALCRGLADERLQRFFAMIVASYRSSLEPLADLAGVRLATHVDARIEAVTEALLSRSASAVLATDPVP